MGDDHVDRLGVEALQDVKLTSTNRPCGLTIKFLRRESETANGYQLTAVSSIAPDSLDVGIGFPGDLSEGATPVPIPNTAVKPSCADDTAY